MSTMTLAGSQPNDPILTNMFMFQDDDPDVYHIAKHTSGSDRLTSNDCYLRNMQKYKYIANMDIDEIIIPRNMSTWSEMMEAVEKLTHNQVILPRLFYPLNFPFQVNFKVNIDDS